MSEGAVINPADIRAFANLPGEVPDSLLQTHIAVAVRDCLARTGFDSAPSGLEEEWVEAHTVRALASVFPWLNTFALDGAARVGRLEGSVTYRFLAADDVEEKVKGLMGRFEELVLRLRAAGEGGADEDFGITTLIAV